MRLAILLTLLGFQAQAAIKAHTEFLAHGTAGMTVHGVSDSFLDGDVKFKGDKLLAGIAKIPLDTFDTGIDLRNHHLRDKYLETKKFPDATLALSTGQGKSWAGHLSLHGKTMPITGDMVPPSKFSFKVDLDKFGITAPSFAGITIKNTVDVTVEIKG